MGVEKRGETASLAYGGQETRPDPMTHAIRYKRLSGSWRGVCLSKLLILSIKGKKQDLAPFTLNRGLKKIKLGSKVSLIIKSCVPRIPKIQSASILDDHTLLIEFDNHQKKKYDISPLLQKEMFAPLKNVALFKSVIVEQGGYAVVWGNSIDISEYELWSHGQAMP